MLPVKFQPVILNCGGTPVQFRPMRVEDYKAVRQLVPLVSRCCIELSGSEVEKLLNLEVYHPWVAYTINNSNPDGPADCDKVGSAMNIDESTEVKLLGFAELIRIPHLGRPLDSRLERVVVVKDFRGKGLATAMCRHLIYLAESLGCGRVELTVDKPEARHIYEDKLGFEQVDTELMRLLLPQAMSGVGAKLK